jgi:hypothetical protein
MAAEQKPDKSAVVKGLIRVSKPLRGALTPAAEQSSPVISDHVQFVPSSDFPGLDPSGDTIIVNSSRNQLMSQPRPGARLEILSDSQREAADRLSKERTKFLTEVTHVLTYPYVDLFARMIPWKPERSGFFGDEDRIVERTDHVPYDEITMDYRTKVAYLLGKDGKHLTSADVTLGNNLGFDQYRGLPNLRMHFSDDRMTSIELAFDIREQERALRILAGDSMLGTVLREQFKPKGPHKSKFYVYDDNSTLKIYLGENMAIDIRQKEELVGGDSDRHSSRFIWEPRQRVFRRYFGNGESSFKGQNTTTKLSQADYFQLLRDMLALIPATEKGSFDFIRRQQIQMKSLEELVREVEKLDLPSEQQFESLLRLMKEDSHLNYMRAGLLEDGS